MRRTQGNTIINRAFNIYIWLLVNHILIVVNFYSRLTGGVPPPERRGTVPESKAGDFGRHRQDSHHRLDSGAPQNPHYECRHACQLVIR